MTLAAEQSSQAAVKMHIGSQILRALLATALLAVSASCLLKYMWWAACYSAWNGVPKLLEQWKLAGHNASFNGWGFILLELIAISTLITLIQFYRLSGFSRLALRLGASLIIAAAGTAAFALLLSVTQIGVR